MKTAYRILYLEDREEPIEQVANLLKREYLPNELCWVRGREGFMAALQGGWGYDLLLVGELEPGFPAMEALALARRRWPELPVILLPGGVDDELADEGLTQGATDVVAWTGLARLVPAMRRALKEAQGLAALKQAEAENVRLAGLLRTVLEASSEGILVVDLAGKITTYNRKFMSLCGIPEYVMAPMDLERVLLFLQEQFADPEAFLSEARFLGDHAERKLLGFLNSKDHRTIEAHGRSQRLGRDAVGKVFSFMDVTEREQATDPLPEALAVPPDLVEAARAGRMVPWYLTEEELVISDKALKLLDLPPGGLPVDLPGLEALIHPEDLDRLRQGLEHPRTAPFDLRMRKGDGSWILTRWNMKRGSEGYRGVFTGMPGAKGAQDELTSGKAAPRFNFLVRNLQA
jgi:PAS domain-containing protein